MWEVTNNTGFAADGNFARDHDGRETWLVAVKATFDLLPDGTTRISEEQTPVHLAAVYETSGDQQLLKYETDFVLRKRHTDILLSGHAYAPNGQPTEQLVAGFSVGDVSKVIAVTGDREWKSGMRGVTPAAPEPFSMMPLTYDRSFGGVSERDGVLVQDERNPVGTGFSVEPKDLLGKPVPNVTYPEDLPELGQRPIRPAGFGPIPVHWDPRRSQSGTHDAAWKRDRYPLAPLDFNELHYQCAPADQWVQGVLRGGETVTLKNLTPSGHFTFNLPQHYFGFQTSFGLSRGSCHHRGQLHTVLIEPTDMRLQMVWQTSLPCQGIEQFLESTLVFEKDVL